MPWDDPLPPPEIMALADGLAPGRGLDLGCGYGRAAIYLAQRGWTMDGVDFLPQAIDERDSGRGRPAWPSGRAFTSPRPLPCPSSRRLTTWLIHIGCMHSFTGELLDGYRGELLRLSPPGGRYVLFAHLRGDGEEGQMARAVFLRLP